MKTPFRADYSYTIKSSVIAIIDLDQGSKSVTNDMENVLDDIRAQIGSLAGYAVIYRDLHTRLFQGYLQITRRNKLQ